MPTVTNQTIESLLSELSFDCPDIFKDKEGFAFCAYECAVFEEEINSSCYVYTAYSINTGKSELLKRKRKPLTHKNDNIAPILRELHSLHIAGRGRIEIDSDTPLSIGKLRTIMNEVFYEIMQKYGFTTRESQINLAHKLLDTIGSRGTLLAEAATGLGKSIAYIIVAILTKRSRLNEHWNTAYFPEMNVIEWKRMPVIINTASIALQRTLIKEVIPEITKMLLENGVIRNPVRTVLAKGRSHYVCRHNLQAYLPYEKKQEISDVLKKLVISGQLIDLAELDDLTAYVKRKICVPVKCYKSCTYAGDCCFKKYRDTIRKGDIDIIVCNHNLLIADAKLRNETGNSLLPPYQMVIFDEAHEILQASHSIYGATLDNDTIPDITRAILDLNYTPFDSVYSKDWRDIRNISHKLAKKLCGQNKRLFTKIDAGICCDRNLKIIFNISSELLYTLNKTYSLKSKVDEKRRIKLISEVEQLSKLISSMVSSVNNIRWFESNTKKGTLLCSLPKNMDELLFNDIWKRGVPALLTSGTLSVSDDFGVLKQTIGLSRVNRVNEAIYPSPYNYKQNCLLYIPENLPSPKQSDKKYLIALADEIERLITASKGHTVVLFTSYYVMETVSYKLEQRKLPYPLFKLKRSTSSAINQFKESGNGILMASGSLWQGIDISGDTLSTLIITKLPFQQPNAISEYERSKYSDFNAYLNEFLVPEMLIKLKQGFGRLIRNETDTGIVAILDSRINSTGLYRESVLSALPSCQVTDDINKVQKFLQAVKSPEYFGNTNVADLFPTWE